MGHNDLKKPPNKFREMYKYHLWLGEQGKLGDSTLTIILISWVVMCVGHCVFVSMSVCVYACLKCPLFSTQDIQYQHFTDTVKWFV